jgi:hypothetical protein
MRTLDRGLSGLLILGAIGHTLGVLKFYRGQPHPLFWALCETLLVLLLAAVNLLRTDRPADRGLAWVATAASAAYILVSVEFGMLMGNLLDPRAVIFGLVSLGSTIFGLRTALGRT